MTTDDRELTTFAGRSIGTSVLVFVQFFIGTIHVFFDVCLLLVSNTDYARAHVRAKALRKKFKTVRTSRVMGKRTVSFDCEQGGGVLQGCRGSREQLGQA